MARATERERTKHAQRAQPEQLEPRKNPEGENGWKFKRIKISAN